MAFNRSLFRHRRPPSAASVPPIVPNTLANLTMWLDGSDGATFTGNPISAWADKSGSGHGAAQTDPARQPPVGAWPLNANSCVEFTTSANYYLDVTGFNFGVPYTLLAVFHSTKALGASSYSGVFTGDAAYYIEGYKDFNPTNGFTADDFLGNDFSVDTGSDYQNVCMVVTGGTVEAYSYAVSVYSGTFNPATTGNYYIGKEDGLFSWLYGELAELILYTDAKTPAQVAGLNSYLVTKWGL